LRHTNFGFENKHIKPTQPKQRCEKAFFCDTQGFAEFMGKRLLTRRRKKWSGTDSTSYIFDHPCFFLKSHVHFSERTVIIMVLNWYLLKETAKAFQKNDIPKGKGTG